MNYIPADKLNAEIERRLVRYDPDYTSAGRELKELLSFIVSLQQEPRFPKYDNIVDKVFGAGNLEGFEYREAEMLVALAKEELLKSLQQEQPEIDLEKEIECSIRFLNGHHTLENGERWYKGRYEELRDFARHFYGLRNRALEEAARHIYKSWMGGTMNGVRNDMVELGKILNARKEE